MIRILLLTCFYLALTSMLRAQASRWSLEFEVPAYISIGTASYTRAVISDKPYLTVYTPRQLKPTTPSLGLDGFLAYRLRGHWHVGGGVGFRVDPRRESYLTASTTRYRHSSLPVYLFTDYQVGLGNAVGGDVRLRAGHHFHRRTMDGNGLRFLDGRGGLLVGADLRIRWATARLRPCFSVGYSLTRYRHTYNPNAFPGGFAKGTIISTKPYQQDLRLAVGIPL